MIPPPSLAAEPRSTGRDAPLVLIVDDFADSREVYAEYLSYSGFRVEEASNAEQALELTHRLHPDIVVMDLSLPLMDGGEATRRLKTDERTCAIPVIVLTGHTQPKHVRYVHDAGCDAFLVKPCLPEKLVAKVEELLQKAAS